MSTTTTKPTRKAGFKPGSIITADAFNATLAKSMQAAIRNVAEQFRFAGDPTRLSLLFHLAANECSVGDLARTLGVSQPVLSHHLRSLRLTRIVEARRDGQRSIYSLTATGRALVESARGMMA